MQLQCNITYRARPCLTKKLQLITKRIGFLLLMSIFPGRGCNRKNMLLIYRCKVEEITCHALESGNQHVELHNRNRHSCTAQNLATRCTRKWCQHGGADSCWRAPTSSRPQVGEQEKKCKTLLRLLLCQPTRPQGNFTSLTVRTHKTGLLDLYLCAEQMAGSSSPPDNNKMRTERRLLGDLQDTSAH